uniref:hypothetical protein n=1 Tax=Bacillus licheniformis TaxID=1402 RepID=UPI001C92C1A0
GVRKYKENEGALAPGGEIVGLRNCERRKVFGRVGERVEEEEKRCGWGGRKDVGVLGNGKVKV